jgi:phosphoserine aminotransferase
MLCVADYLDALQWVRSLGGVAATMQRCDRNLGVIEAFVAEHDWIEFLAADASTRSNTSVCLKLELEPERVKELVALLAEEGVAYDIGAYRAAPAGLRIWCGATVEASDLEKLMPWLEWGYAHVKGSE